MSDHRWIRYAWFSLFELCLFSFAVSLLKWLAHSLLIRINGKNLQQFLARKITISSTFFFRVRFQGYRCKSGIGIFAWSQISLVPRSDKGQICILSKLEISKFLNIFLIPRPAPGTWTSSVYGWMERRREKRQDNKDTWTDRFYIHGILNHNLR